MNLDTEYQREFLIASVMDATFQGKYAVNVMEIVGALRAASIGVQPAVEPSQSKDPESLTGAPFLHQAQDQEVGLMMLEENN